VAKAGDKIESPLGPTLVFRQTSRDSDGRLLEMEAVYRPSPLQPPEHYHPRQEERFEVLSGALRVRISGKERVYGADENFTVRRGARHSMSCVGDEETRVAWQVRPALRTETFFETMWGLSRDGKVNSKGRPGLLRGSVILKEYSPEVRLAQPPYLLQLVAFSLLAPIGRFLGFRARYDKYSGP
jgi:quercetin dioxygenase-like cupin family protein